MMKGSGFYKPYRQDSDGRIRIADGLGYIHIDFVLLLFFTAVACSTLNHAYSPSRYNDHMKIRYLPDL